MVWTEAALVTVCLSFWWGNYSLLPGSYSLDLHHEVLTCSCSSEVCNTVGGRRRRKKIPPHQPNEDGLFSLPGGLWTSHSDGRNILIVFDNNTRRCEMDRTRRRAAVPAHCSDNHVLSSAECFHRSVMLMFLVLRSKSMCLTSAACVFGEVGVRERGQIQGRGDYQAALDNSQVVDLRGLESDHCLLVCTCSSKKYEKKKFKINNKKVWF